MDLQLFAELTSEEQAKFNEYAKTMGWDGHANDVLKKTRDEAKTYREQLDAEKAKIKTFEEAEAKRKADEEAAAKKKADEEAARKKADEDKNKTFEERLTAKVAEIEAAFGKQLTAVEEKAAKKQQEYLEGLKKRDSKVLLTAVRAAAHEAGIIDKELVSLLDLSKVEIKDGEIDDEAVQKLITEHKAAKPHLYGDRATNARQRNEFGQFAPSEERPAPQMKDGKPVDWSRLSNEEFERMEREMRAARA